MVRKKCSCGVTLDDLKGEVLADGLLSSEDSGLQCLAQLALTDINQGLCIEQYPHEEVIKKSSDSGSSKSSRT